MPQPPLAPPPSKLSAVPDDGAAIIETTGVEVVESWAVAAPVSARLAPSSNDNAEFVSTPFAQALEDITETSPVGSVVVPFAATLRRVI